MNKTIFFEPSRRIISGRDVTEYVFPFRVVNTDLVGGPDEKLYSSRHTIKVAVTETLSATWEFTDDELHRVMFEYGKRHTIQKLQDGTLREVEELDLHTGNAQYPCPFNPAQIENPMKAVITLELSNKKLMEDPTFLQLAASIIDTRDNINAILHHKYKEKLILIGEERDLLQFFRDAQSNEEFFFRLSALSSASTKMNVECLRRLTGISDTRVKSIQLLEEYLRKSNVSEQSIIDTLRRVPHSLLWVQFCRSSLLEA